MDPNIATLALEDGSVLTGSAFGAPAERVFELVFNTSMSGYQEIISDPSYQGQGVVFTSSHIGNVGVNPEDVESDTPQVSAIVVRALSPYVSNWRATEPLAGWLERHGVPGIAEVDTRSLTRKLRDQGTMRAALSTRGAPASELIEMARAWPGLDGVDMVSQVTCAEPYRWSGDPAEAWVEPAPASQRKNPHIVVVDFGAKRNILRHLRAFGARVSVAPAGASGEEILALGADGIVLSNGPGDPAGLPYAVKSTRRLLESEVPVFGICLGHQLLGLALGGRTQRLKFGHHGGNHPVQDLESGSVLITSQNHNYCVAPSSLDPQRVTITHTSLNDGSVEGLRLNGRPVLSVQFHPEASPGPHDAHGIFARFFELVNASASENRSQTA